MIHSLLDEIKRKKIFSYYAIVLLCCLQSFVLTICVTEIIKRIVYVILEGKHEIGHVLLTFVLIYITYSLIVVLNKTISFGFNKFSTQTIEKRILIHISQLDEWELSFDGLKVLAQIKNDVYKLPSSWISLLNMQVGICTSIIFGTIYGIHANYIIYLGCMFVTGIIYLVTKRAYPKLKEYEYQIGNEFNKNYANINEIINNIGILHLLKSKKVVREFQKVSNKNVELNVNKGKAFAQVFICKKISSVFLVFLTCALGVLLCDKNKPYIATVSEISALAYLIPGIAKKALEFIDFGVQKNNFIAAKERVESIFELRKYDCDNKIDIQDIDRIQVKNLKYSYSKKPVITGLTFEMHKGTILVLRGASGCGKSTLMKLMCRAIPVGDEMIYINSLDINNIDRTSIWNNTGYVSQSPHVMNGTIKDNILAGEEYDELRYVEAMTVSTLIDSIKNFQNGSEQVVNDEIISSGEAQKIALARAIYKRPQFLCLDEVVSAMDPLSQKTVLIRLADYVKKYNVFCAYISHVVDGDLISEFQEVWM